MKKARKSKFVIGGVALLSCVALAGVGYSSWVITSQINSQTGNVSVTAADVIDNRVTIGNISGTDMTYSFGPSTGEEGSGTLITASGSTSEESLSVSFSFTITYSSTMDTSYNITLALASNKTYAASETSTVDALAYATETANYLTAPASGLVGSTGITIATVSKDGVTESSSYSSDITGAGLKVAVSTTNSVTTVTVTAAFGWGSYFNSVNPVNLEDSSKLDSYVTGLQWLNTNLNNAEFTYTIGGAVSA